MGKIKDMLKEELFERLNDEIDLFVTVYFNNYSYMEYDLTEENIAEVLFQLLYNDEVAYFVVDKRD